MNTTQDGNNSSKMSTNRNPINRTSTLTAEMFNSTQKRNCSKSTERSKHSFHPSIRHNKIYEQSTPYEKSLEKIRSKYQKERELIYGVDFKSPSSTFKNHNMSINEMARNSVDKKPKDKKKFEYLTSHNFSKLIAFTSMIAVKEPRIKLSLMDEYLRSKADELEKLNFTTAQNFQNNIYMLLNELAMSKTFEIAPQDFIEFIKEKNLNATVINIYDTQIKLNNMDKISSVKKLFEEKIHDLFTTEKKICLEANTVLNMQSTLRDRLSSHRTSRAPDTLRRTCTLKNGKTQEQELSSEKWKCKQITPMYFNLLQKQQSFRK